MPKESRIIKNKILCSQIEKLFFRHQTLIFFMVTKKSKSKIIFPISKMDIYKCPKSKPKKGLENSKIQYFIYIIDFPT